MGKSDALDVLVVGAGPVGLMTAIALHDKGARVRIIDRAGGPNQEAFALALHPAVLRLFDDLGMAEGMIGRGRLVRRVIFFEGSRPRALADLSLLSTPHPYTLVLPQGELEEVLIGRLRDSGITVEWNHELESFHQDGGIKATIVRKTESPQGYAVSDMRRVETGRQEVSCHYLVGADGAHSTVRRMIGADLVVYDRPRFYSAFEFHTPGLLENELHIVFSDRGLNALWPMRSGRGRWTFEISSDRSALPPEADFMALLRERVPAFANRPLKVNWSGRVSFAHWHSSAFARGRVFLAGDAAHQTSPLGVQSMNNGLLEASYLADLLTGSGGSTSSDELAAEYNDNRLSAWGWILDARRRKGHAPASDDAWLRMNAERILPTLPVTSQLLPSLLTELRPISELEARQSAGDLRTGSIT